MPFGTKPTGLPPGQSPTEVDFDALWSEAIKPALETLGFRPVRADEQSGSVIIKDMLAQLVHADLVIADISLPNGNVYYEAGVRHAARENGCVLINASWARPLFDLQQITYLGYPFQTDKPKKADYDSVKTALVEGIPGLVEAAGPVFELVHTDDQADPDSRLLNEQAGAWFDFEVNLRRAVIAAESGGRNPLRQLATDSNLDHLPAYALKDLVIAVRDNLNWGELQQLVSNLPQAVAERGWFQEQQALAAGKLGKIPDAIALLEGVIEKDGPTPDRYGNIGSRYRELARKKGNKLDRVAMGKAISAYESGLELDLNDYYCAHKLLVTYVERNRKDDRARAERCALHVALACDRALKQNPNDEWLAPTRLILAFFNGDAAAARPLLDGVLDSGWSNWKLLGLLTDIKALYGIPIDDALDETYEKYRDDETQLALVDMIKEIQDELPVTQALLIEKLLERLKTEPLYKKFQHVEARLATPDEVIVSVTEAGEETTNVAKAGDIVVRNQTQAREEYIVAGETFSKRYVMSREPSDDWLTFEPAGEVRALEITHDVTTLLDVGNQFFIEAPWGERQFAAEGDYLVSPAPEHSEIYRIDRVAFDETYAKKASAD